MKPVFDQNLSPTLVMRLADLFPDASHVEAIDLDCASLPLWRKRVNWLKVVIIIASGLMNGSLRRRSFKRTWTTFNQFLLSAMFTDAAQRREKYRTALSYATLDKLPNRPGRRFEREAYP